MKGRWPGDSARFWDTPQAHADEVRRAKIHLEVIMLRGMEASESFYSCISSRRKIGESVSSLLNREGPHATQDIHSMPPSPQTLLLSWILWSHSTLRPLGKSRARKTHLWWRRIRLENIKKKKKMDILMGAISKWWGSCLSLLQGHSQWSLEGCGNWNSFLWTGLEEWNCSSNLQEMQGVESRELQASHAHWSLESISCKPSWKPFPNI